MCGGLQPDPERDGSTRDLRVRYLPNFVRRAPASSFVMR